MATVSVSSASLFVFGDSLSDGGNVYAATGGAVPGAGYYNGRFSNGPIWADKLAAHLGTALTPSLTGGNDYAWGGAETGTGLSGDGTPNVGTQIATFAGGGGHFSSTDLVTLWAGPNDFIQGQTNPLVPANNIGTEIDALYALGARRILVPNMVELGYTPDLVGTSAEAQANQVSLLFDQALHAQIQSKRASDAGITLYELDVNSLFLNVLQNPNAYGFKDTTHAYLGSGSTADPNTFIFFDSLHPTAKVHDLIGQAAIEAVPEPATMAVFGIALASLIRRKRSKA